MNVRNLKSYSIHPRWPRVFLEGISEGNCQR